MELINGQSSAVFEQEQISNKELLEYVNKVYQALEKNGYSDQRKIALYMERDVSLLYVITAILATNSMYIPIDVKLPEKRVEYILECSKPDVLITNIKFRGRFSGENVLYVEELLEMSGLVYPTPFPNKLGLGGAYILFTSGTTGVPKGVVVSKEALKNFMQGTLREIDFSGCSSIICITTISFDIFFLESIFALYAGLRVIMTNESEQQNPRKLARMLLDYKVEAIQITPSKLRQMHAVDREFACLRDARVIIVGGEAFPPYMLDILEKNTRAEIYNAYGPTEATIWISYSHLNGKTEIDIGKPMQNNKFFILDDLGEIVLNGENGELCISGANLADGYLNDVGQTRDKFVELKLHGETTRVFKTGDIGYIDCRGNARCLGRRDHQVKINGYRIELEEIESRIAKYEGITNAVVLCQESERSKALVCVYSGEKGAGDRIKKWLGTYLPDYMIPQRFIWISEFQYTIGGKADRDAIARSAGLL